MRMSLPSGPAASPGHIEASSQQSYYDRVGRPDEEVASVRKLANDMFSSSTKIPLACFRSCNTKRITACTRLRWNAHQPKASLQTLGHVSGSLALLLSSPPCMLCGSHGLRTWWTGELRAPVSEFGDHPAPLAANLSCARNKVSYSSGGRKSTPEEAQYSPKHVFR